MLPFQEAVASDLQQVNDLIIQQLHSDVGLVENIGHYIVDAGGKRLRPILVLLTANCLGTEDQKHIDLAAVIEFIHTATLLHDDVVDTSDLRRGRPTANARFGNAPSVLVGDFLYSRAFQMLVQLGSMEVMRILSDTTNLISEGEVQQLVNAGNPETNESDYRAVIHKKTAALFEAACLAAATLKKAGPTEKHSAWEFGHHLGMAFQLIDDALDYEGDADELGKNVGDDLAEGKPTLPLIFAMENGSNVQRDVIKQAIVDGGLPQLQEVIHIVQTAGGLQYTRKCAEHHAEQARSALAQLPNNRFRTAMEELTAFSVRRTY